MKVRASLTWEMDVNPEHYRLENPTMEKMAEIDKESLLEYGFDGNVPEDAVLNYHPIAEVTADVPRNEDGSVVTRRKFLHAKVPFGTQGEYTIECVDEFCSKNHPPEKTYHRHVESEIYLP